MTDEWKVEDRKNSTWQKMNRRELELQRENGGLRNRRDRAEIREFDNPFRVLKASFENIR